MPFASSVGHTVRSFTMLPYLQVQLAYVVAACVAVLALDRLAGRVARLERSLRLRTLAVAAALALPLALGALLVRTLDHTHSTWQFAAVALGFYGGLNLLPLLALARALRRPRDPALALAGLALLALSQYALWIEPDRLVESVHEVPVAAWDAGERLRIVHVSDLQTVGECERERDAARRINALAPDLIVITGDYVAGPLFDPEPAVRAARRFLGELERPRLGIVCVPGHSETEALRERVFEGLGITYLRDREVEFSLGARARLSVFGTRTLHQGLDLARLATRREPGLVRLVASHEPDLSPELDGRGIDLHLAGHTHGGQLALPFLGPPMTLSTLPRRFARGLHRLGDHALHVSAGIGMEGNHAPRIRFLCPPAIDMIVLTGTGGPRGAHGADVER